MKKFLSVMLSILMFLQLGTTVFASDGTVLGTFLPADQEELKVLLSDVTKDIFPMTRSNQEISLGNEIYSYEVTNDGIRKMDYQIYPIFINGILSLFAYKIPSDNGEYDIQLTEALVDELKESALGEEIALLYDAGHCFVVTQDMITPLVEFSVAVEEREIIGSENDIREVVELNSLNEIETINLSGRVSQRATNASKSLGVSYVSQNPPSSICWAASMACIGNYLTSYSYSAKTFAQKVYGTSDWNKAASTATAVSGLKNVYGVSYIAGVGRPSTSKIQSNINAGYPVYATWSYSGGRHATVVRGYSEISSIYVMDPEFGFTTATYKLSGFQYVSGYSGVTLTLDGYAAKM